MSFHIEPINHALLNEVEYETYNGMKMALTLYNYLDRCSRRGDTVAHSILVDLKTAIYSGYLTERQLEAVELYFIYCMTQDDIARIFGISKQGVSRIISRSVRTIQKTLQSGELYGRGG